MCGCIMLVAFIISFALLLICPPLGILGLFLCWRVILTAWKDGEDRERN